MYKSWTITTSSSTGKIASEIVAHDVDQVPFFQVAQPVQQLVNPLERVDDVELSLKDPLNVRRTQRADAIGRQRPGIQA